MFIIFLKNPATGGDTLSPHFWFMFFSLGHLAGEDWPVSHMDRIVIFPYLIYHYALQI